MGLAIQGVGGFRVYRGGGGGEGFRVCGLGHGTCFVLEGVGVPSLS